MEVKLSLKKFLSKVLVATLGLLVVCLAVYIFGLPLYPEIKYDLAPGQPSQAIAQLPGEEQNSEVSQAADTSTEAVLPAVLPASETKTTRKGNYLLIPKIGVDIPIVDSDNSKWALNRGAWRLPQTSTPDKGSNTAIAGHRFKYLPPSNLTFYLLDKLAKGDKITIFWSGTIYNYRVTETKIVPPTEVSVLDATAKSIVTLITCDPIFTQKNRLIVIGELINQ
jgi:LPXTG-site transpeptidase (sortase) family protein